jgi:hypothetical protein
VGDIIGLMLCCCAVPSPILSLYFSRHPEFKKKSVSGQEKAKKDGCIGSSRKMLRLKK